jgi:Cys-tRNA(Pro) deacylase
MDYPITPAVRALRAKKIEFEPRSAQMLGVDEHAVVKTLIFETDARKPFIILMHGDLSVSAKQLARTLGVKSAQPCPIERAQKLTGYLVGGTSPFATRTAMPVYVEKTIFELPRIYINGGKRGFLVELEPRVLKELLPLTEIEVGIEDS